MIGLLVSFVAGMRRWTAWSPLIVTAISLPFTILRWNNSNAWRAEVHRLAQHDIADLALAIAGGTALNYAVFGIGFGVAVAIDRIRRRRSSHNNGADIMPTKDNTRIIARLRGAPAIAATPETESHPHNPIVRPEDLPADFGRLPPDPRDTRIAELEAALHAAKMHLECSAFNVSSPKAKRQYRDAVDAVDKVLAKPS